MIYEIIRNFALKLIARKKAELVLYSETSERAKFYDFIAKIRKENELKQSVQEALNLFTATRNTKKIEGVIAEVGVYKGGSAKVICEAKGNRVLYLFDTFAGMPEVSEKDKGVFRTGQDFALMNCATEYLKDYKNVHFFKGIFPDTAEPIKDKKFSFVHLDVDIYESVRDCLEFFYPRMSKGGIIITHDYIQTVFGVREAVNTFLKDKPEPIIELLRSQAMIVKLS